MNGMESPDFSSLSNAGPSARTSWASQGDLQISCSLVIAVVMRMFHPILLSSLVKNILPLGLVRFGVD
jgi:hypothetical protein